MGMAEAASVTQLLRHWQERPDDPDAGNRFARAVYAELRRLAAAQLRRETHTAPSPTDLVHDIWLRLDASQLHGDSRRQFFRVAALAMRNLLVDRARERLAQKRGAGVECVSLRWAEAEAAFSDPRLIDLDAALERLRRDHPRHAQVVELRCFAGLELAQIGETLGISLATVKRDWAFANAWLSDALGDGA